MSEFETPLSQETRAPAPLKTVDAETVKKNVTNVLEELSKNRHENLEPAHLIAVVNTVTPETIQHLKPLQILDIAENRAQVALPKLPQIDTAFRLHWIGRLQTNKVKYIIDQVSLLHTLDRLALAQEIDRQADRHQRVLPCLVQVNLAREPQKAGLALEEVRPFLRQMKDFRALKVKGLMAIMPLTDDEKCLAELFRGMRTLFDQLRQEAISGVSMDELSMGMSHDYRIAAREGATMVRVGSALFS